MSFSQPGRFGMFVRFLLAGFVFLCTCAAPGLANAACELRVGWDEWPYYFTYERGNFHGLEYDLLKSTADTTGCKLDFLQVPWVRALKMLGAGELELLYGAGYSAERAEFARFSIPYRHEQFLLVTRSKVGDGADSVSLNDWIRSERAVSDPVTIGVFRGNFYGEQIEGIVRNKENNVTLAELNDNDQLIGMLGAGRIDGFIIEDGVAQTELRGSPFPIHRYAIREQPADPLHYMFSFGVAEDVVQRFNNAIRERQSQGR
jgi:polar amino acid transport system substrate-binding protein